MPSSHHSRRSARHDSINDHDDDDDEDVSDDDYGEYDQEDYDGENFSEAKAPLMPRLCMQYGKA